MQSMFLLIVHQLRCSVRVHRQSQKSCVNGFKYGLRWFGQRQNLRILYDAIGTLADAVGSELNNVRNFSTLLLFIFCFSF